ncbi:MAG: TfoX/Sxy family protein [Vicinamibacterales bacterium]
MRVSTSFHDFVVDQLSGVKGLRTRAMFGGVGVYADDVFFGILARDVLYFKVDESNRRDHVALGGQAFHPYEDRSMTMPYYSVPVSVLEDQATLTDWALRSLAVATAGRKPAGPKRRRRSTHEK